MPTDAVRLAVARQWLPAGTLRVAKLFTTGHSGADVSQVEHSDSGRLFVLKRFGTGADRHRAEFVHRLIRHVATRAEPHIADVAATPAGATLWDDGTGGLWELSRFLGGEPTPEPGGRQVAAAAAALAGVHEAAATLPGHAPRRAPPRSLVERQRRAVALLHEPWSRFTTRSGPDGRPDAGDFRGAVLARVALARQTLTDCGGAAFIARVARDEPGTCVVQAVLRDVWHEHVLFFDRHDCRVTGFIDAHAAGIDTPATDLARLLGSWPPRDAMAHLPLPDRWPEAWRAYAAVRPLPEDAERLAQLLHATGVVLGLDSWFRWTLAEGRRFSDALGALGRIDRLITELPRAIAATWPENVD